MKGIATHYDVTIFTPEGILYSWGDVPTKATEIICQAVQDSTPFNYAGESGSVVCIPAMKGCVVGVKAFPIRWEEA